MSGFEEQRQPCCKPKIRSGLIHSYLNPRVPWVLTNKKATRSPSSVGMKTFVADFKS